MFDLKENFTLKLRYRPELKNISLRRRPARSCSQKARFRLLGRNAAKRAQKIQTTLCMFPVRIGSHEPLPSLTPDFVPRRSNGRRLTDQLASRRHTVLDKRRPGCPGSHQCNV